VSADTILTEITASVIRYCAYCGARARYLVFDVDGRGAGYCCAEPSHWTWLVGSLGEFLEGLDGEEVNE
jgi:hypothetical protein